MKRYHYGILRTIYTALLLLVLQCNGLAAEDNKVVEYFLSSAEVQSDLFIASKIINEGQVEWLNFFLQDYQLASLTKAQLRVLRNSIFARYGYEFKSTDLQEHFGRFDWYKPTTRNVDTRMTVIDKWNIEHIFAFEQFEYEDVWPLDTSTITGFWHGFAGFPAGLSNSWFFFEDGTFVYSYNTMNQASRMRWFEGTWLMSGNLITARVARSLYTSGGQVEDSGAFGYSIVDSEQHIRRYFDLTLRYPMSSFQPSVRPEYEPDNEVAYMNIGTTEYWHLRADPAEYLKAVPYNERLTSGVESN